MCCGRLFHTRDAATGNDGSSTVVRRVRRTTGIDDDDERSLHRARESAGRLILSARYGSTDPCRIEQLFNSSHLFVICRIGLLPFRHIIPRSKTLLFADMLCHSWRRALFSKCLEKQCTRKVHAETQQSPLVSVWHTFSSDNYIQHKNDESWDEEQVESSLFKSDLSVKLYSNGGQQPKQHDLTQRKYVTWNCLTLCRIVVIQSRLWKGASFKTLRLSLIILAWLPAALNPSGRCLII